MTFRQTMVSVWQGRPGQFWWALGLVLFCTATALLYTTSHFWADHIPVDGRSLADLTCDQITPPTIDVTDDYMANDKEYREHFIREYRFIRVVSRDAEHLHCRAEVHYVHRVSENETEDRLCQFDVAVRPTKMGYDREYGVTCDGAKMGRMKWW